MITRTSNVYQLIHIGPWELALENYFPPKQGHVHLADEILYGWTVEARFARYIRFQCLQYLHSGCSLKYFIVSVRSQLKTLMRNRFEIYTII